jgi:flavin-dependent dehydrogenase
MDSCDALIVGGGPAGSSCAWRLVQAGLDVLVVDAAVFPRDKVCAGWITPPVLSALDLDTEDYRQGRTLQPITAFRVGLITGRRDVHTKYGHPVSYGIRRCEFDHYLLRRSGARLQAGTRVTSVRRADGRWIVNDAIRARLLIGAGGQFCPVARAMNGLASSAPLVVAQEAEYPIEAGDAASSAIDGETPELYFCRDLKGYGWCFRKGSYLNVGLGRLDRQSLPRATSEFLTFLTMKGKISAAAGRRWRGHAYSVYESPHRCVVGEGMMLVGDAAGLAYPESGEGIRPAVESGLLAAATVVAASGDYSGERLQPYEERLRARFGTRSVSGAVPAMIPAQLGTLAARQLLKTPAFVRHVVLDRWFLHS